MKKNRKGDIFRIILESDIYETLLVAFPYRALNVDRF